MYRHLQTQGSTEWLPLAQAWWDEFRDHPVTVKELCVHLALDLEGCSIDLPVDLSGAQRVKPGWLRRSLGRHLGGLAGNTIGDFVICDAGIDAYRHVRRWRLRRVADLPEQQGPPGAQVVTASRPLHPGVRVQELLRTEQILGCLRNGMDLPSLCAELGVTVDFRILRSAIIERSNSEAVFRELTARMPKELLPAAHHLWMSWFVHADRPQANLRRLRSAVRAIDRLACVFRVALERMYS